MPELRVSPYRSCPWCFEYPVWTWSETIAFSDKIAVVLDHCANPECRKVVRITFRLADEVNVS